MASQARGGGPQAHWYTSEFEASVAVEAAYALALHVCRCLQEGSLCLSVRWESAKGREWWICTPPFAGGLRPGRPIVPNLAPDVGAARYQTSHR